MSRRPTLLLALGLGACAEAPPPEDLFQVVEVEPADGTTTANAMVFVYLSLSDPPDAERCTPDTVRVDAVRDDGTVAFAAPVELSFSGEKFVKLLPEAPYLGGWTYRVTVQGGDDGCADVDGVPILPFASTFEVP